MSTKGVFRWKKNFLRFGYCSTFVCIWQLMSNHRLIWRKRFVLWFTTKLCNYLFFLSIFNVPYICSKIRCDRTKNKNLEFWWQSKQAHMHRGFGRPLSDRRIHAADLSCNMQEDLKSIQPAKGHTDLQQFCLPRITNTGPSSCTMSHEPWWFLQHAVARLWVMVHSGGAFSEITGRTVQQNFLHSSKANQAQWRSIFRSCYGMMCQRLRDNERCASLPPARIQATCPTLQRKNLPSFQLGKSTQVSWQLIRPHTCIFILLYHSPLIFIHACGRYFIFSPSI
jgi:hypothetical protein